MDQIDEFSVLAKERFNRVYLAVIILACMAVTLYVNLVMGIDVVYTHLFYIPIILAGLWYHRKAALVALFLGLAHVAIAYYIAGHIVPESFIRAAIFLIIALVVGALSENKDRLYESVRLLLESTDEGIVGVDMHDNCTFINRSALRMLGYTVDEVRGKYMHALIRHRKADGRPCEAAECCVNQSLATGLGCRKSGDLFGRKDGSSIPVEYSSYPIQENGRIIGAVVTFVDIAERLKAEGEVRDARRQAELYVDLMGHDINNLNQVGISFLELGLEKLRLGDADKVYLLKPLGSLYSSTQLIDTVRKLQTIREGGLKHERVDLCRMLREVAAHYAHVPGRDVTIKLEAAGECPVLADPLLRDVFGNIVGNAIKHSSGPVTVNIHVEPVVEDGRQYYRVDIRDDGPGIPDELKGRLFRRHERGTAAVSGHGLGLYLVKKLVDDFHGKVWVEDAVPGDYRKGTKFVVMLPMLTSSPS